MQFDTLVSGKMDRLLVALTTEIEFAENFSLHDPFALRIFENEFS